MLLHVDTKLCVKAFSSRDPIFTSSTREAHLTDRRSRGMKPALPRTCQRLNRCSSMCVNTPYLSSEGQFPCCDELLQLNLATAHEAKGRIHRSWTIHLPLVKAPHGISVVKVYPARVVIQANTQPQRHGKYAVAGVTDCGSGRWGNGRGRRGLGDEELAHANSEEGEGLGELVARVLTATVMAAIVVIPGNKKTTLMSVTTIIIVSVD